MTDKPRHRSPNYPYIGLKDALEKAGKILDAGGIHPVGFAAAMSAWNYKSGSANSAIAALRSFKLIDVTGEGDKRQIKVTDDARKILSDHSEKAELLKKVALGPTLYKELWDKYNGELPPSNKVISEYLVFTRHFNPAVVDAVIKDFRDTIAFANLSTSDIIENDGGEPNEVDDPPANENKGGDSGSGKGGTNKPPALGKGIMFNITIDVLEDGQINVTNGGTLTSETFAILGDVFKLKEKYGKEPPKASDESVGYDFSTGEEPGRMN